MHPSVTWCQIIVFSINANRGNFYKFWKYIKRTRRCENANTKLTAQYINITIFRPYSLHINFHVDMTFLPSVIINFVDFDLNAGFQLNCPIGFHQYL